MECCAPFPPLPPPIIYFAESLLEKGDLLCVRVHSPSPLLLKGVQGFNALGSSSVWMPLLGLCQHSLCVPLPTPCWIAIPCDADLWRTCFILWLSGLLLFLFYFVILSFVFCNPLMEYLYDFAHCTSLPSAEVRGYTCTSFWDVPCCSGAIHSKKETHRDESCHIH